MLIFYVKIFFSLFIDDTMKKIAVLISGGGSNLKAIIDAIAHHQITAKIQMVIADRECAGKNHAVNANIPFYLIERKSSNFTEELLKALPEEIDLIVLAGFLSVIPEALVLKFPNKIINLHPSLLPKFGGMGMYGMKVHQAVIDAGETESGCTVHFVDTGVDTGQPIQQAKVPVLSDDTAEALAKRIQKEEHALLISVIQQLTAE